MQRVSQVDTFGLGIVFGAEREHAVGQVSGAEVGYGNGDPRTSLAHSHPAGLRRAAVHREIDLFHGPFFVGGSHVYQAVGALFSHAELVAALVHADEGVGVHAHALRLVGRGHAHLIGFLQVAPLRLAVVPHDGFWRARAEHVALDGNGARCGAQLRPRGGEVGRCTARSAHYGRRAVEHLPGLRSVLCPGSKGDQCHECDE